MASVQLRYLCRNCKRTFLVESDALSQRPIDVLRHYVSTGKMHSQHYCANRENSEATHGVGDLVGASLSDD